MNPPGPPRVGIEPHVCGKLCDHIGRESMLVVVMDIAEYLPALIDECRSNRLKTPANCFRFDHSITVGRRAWGLAFAIEDSGWPERLRVVEVIVHGGRLLDEES